MLKAEITPGAHYPFRERRKPGASFERVKVLEHIGGNKWKAEWMPILEQHQGRKFQAPALKGTLKDQVGTS
jgi:hypothetical protein